MALANANTTMHYLAYIIHTISDNVNFRKQCPFSGAKGSSIAMSLGNAFLVCKYGLKIGLKRSFENKNLKFFNLPMLQKDALKLTDTQTAFLVRLPSDRWPLLESTVY